MWHRGYTLEEVVRVKEQLYRTPSYVIPDKGGDRATGNLQYRRGNPPEFGLTSQVFIGKGAIEGMVAACGW